MRDDGSADGTVAHDGNEAVIRFERHLPYSPDEVWSALTEPARVLQWWGDLDIEPRPGGRFDLTWLNPTPDGDRFTMHALITTFHPPTLLETSGDAHGVLRWELTAEEGGTTLVFTSTLVLADEFRTRVLAGWHFHLLALAHTLAGGTVDLVELPGWNAIHERYLAENA
jgi:uncharacterized protein YndB with AHSA1/START domain